MEEAKGGPGIQQEVPMPSGDLSENIGSMYLDEMASVAKSQVPKQESSDSENEVELNEQERQELRARKKQLMDAYWEKIKQRRQEEQKRKQELERDIAQSADPEN